MDSVMVIGDAQSIAGFWALGADTAAAETQAEVYSALENARRTGYGLILMTEAAAALAGEAAYEQSQGAPVLVLPGETGNTGQAAGRIQHSIRQAVGAGLWGEEG